MAYIKQTWVNGDVITADKLNHIEEGIKNNDPGYEVTEESVTLFEGEVTTVNNNGMNQCPLSDISFNQQDILTIIFDGVEYQCEKIIISDGYFYGGINSSTGALDFTNYPFTIGVFSSLSSSLLATANQGTYSLIIKTNNNTIVNTTQNFNKAVLKNIKINNIQDANNGGIIEGLIPGLKIDNTIVLTTENANKATGIFAHVEGGNFGSYDGEYYFYPNIASGAVSHAEGSSTTASGQSSHAEGAYTIASGYNSHAEGANTTASGDNSHVEGGGTAASGLSSHAEGYGTIANHKSQHVIGQYNIEDPSSTDSTQRGNYVYIIGNGTATNARSNALAIKWDGTIVLSDGTEVTQAQIKQLLALLN